MDQDIWDCSRREKLISKQNLTNIDIWGHSRNRKAPSYKQRNTVAIVVLFTLMVVFKRLSGKKSMVTPPGTDSVYS